VHYYLQPKLYVIPKILAVDSEILRYVSHKRGFASQQRP
jgi:hypothetical protein